ncbi:hypothetical protein E2P81_ATG08208 [Venturia nashicola]|nr:hypothetical protein E2P81_ATG08208 [Venturia nashicola]
MHLQLLFVATSAFLVAVHGNPLPIDDNTYPHSFSSESSLQPGKAVFDSASSNSNSRARDLVLSRAQALSKRKELIDINHLVTLCAYTDFHKCVEITSPDRICQTVPKQVMNGISLLDGIVSFKLGDDPPGYQYCQFYEDTGCNPNSGKSYWATESQKSISPAAKMKSYACWLMENDPSGKRGKDGKVQKFLANVELWAKNNKVPWNCSVEFSKDLVAGAGVMVGLGGCRDGRACPNGKDW